MNTGSDANDSLADISQLFAEYKGKFKSAYKDLKGLKPHSALHKIFRARRAEQEIDERNEKYRQIDQMATKLIGDTFDALSIAQAQKDAFVHAGKPFASVSILESAAELGYAPHDEYAGTSCLLHLVTREFLKITDPKLQKRFLCQCCPKKPAGFNTAEALR